MPASLFSIEPLLPAIERNCLILTPNSRLRRKVLEAYNQHCSASGKSVWQGPRIFALADWVDATYQELLDAAALAEPRIVASDAQQRALWLEIINSDVSGSALINPLSLANDATAAYRALLRWQLTTADVTRFAEAENSALTQWISDFEQRLKRLQLCLPEHTYQHISDAFTRGQLPREAGLLALGFEDTAPLLDSLFQAITPQPEFVAAISRLQPAACQLVKCDSSEAEVRAAANWALAQLTADGNANIGIIAPNLGQSRKLIERIFIETFEPHYALPQTQRYTLPFNFSAGVPLGSVALIHTTLQLLKLNFSRWPVAALVDLLNSPFWGPAADLNFIQQLTMQLRFNRREYTSTSQLRRYCHRQLEDAAITADPVPEDAEQSFGTWLDNALQSVESLRRQHPRAAVPSQWASLFEAQLRTLGWPGSRRPDSNEFQQLNQWYQLLEDFVRFDISLGKIDCASALDLLGQLAMSTHFQAQTPDSPIQILGILEGAGLEFSHCWVLGMAQKDWPPAAQPNPLLPLALQRQYAMPHADASRELRYAQRLTDNYRRCAEQVMFSFAAQDDAAELQPSPLVADLPQLAATAVWQQASGEWHDYLQRLLQTRDLQWLNLNTAPPVANAELANLRGGTSILKDQAILPAAAFLLHRAGAESNQQIANGLTPMQRGQVLHDSLADIWTQLQTRQALLEMEPRQLDQLLDARIAEHLGNLQRREPSLLGAQYLALEAQRQAQLLRQWLQLEKQRPEFSVQAVEQALDISLQGIPLRLRLDRVDQLHSGERVMIDYKTGKVAARQWAGERPEEPQLPLYCLSYNEPIDAIMFAGINATDVQIIGLGGLSVDHPGFLSAEETARLELPAAWADIVTHWRLVLENLATEFLSGDCNWQVKSSPLRRHYEYLAPLLRWAETAEIDACLRAQPEPKS